MNVSIQLDDRIVERLKALRTDESTMAGKIRRAIMEWIVRCERTRCDWRRDQIRRKKLEALFYR